jgi:MFS family permease
VLARLGLPRMSGQRSMVAALVVDSLGDGLFVPFAIVYFLHTTSLSLSAIGACLSVAGLLALPSVLPAGVLVDRFSSTGVVVAGNLLSGLAFAGYLVVANAWQLVLFALLAGLGGRFYWTANLGLIGDAFSGGERARWFALQRALRNAGFGLGGLLGAVAISLGSDAGYRALAAVNAVSYLAAAAVVLFWSRRLRRSAGQPAALQRATLQAVSYQTVGDQTVSQVVGDQTVITEQAGRDDAGPPHTGPHSTGVARRGYRAALSDRPFMLLTATNVLFVLCSVSLEVLLSVFVLRALHQPVWLAGALFAVNTIASAVGQTPLSAAVAGLGPIRVLQLSGAVWAVSFALFWLASGVPGTAAIASVTLAVVVFTVAEMIQGPVVNDLVVALAPAELRGRYLGTYQLSWALSRAVAPALFTWLFSEGANVPWTLLAVACAGWTALLSVPRLPLPGLSVRRATLRLWPRLSTWSQQASTASSRTGTTRWSGSSMPRRPRARNPAGRERTGSRRSSRELAR